MAVTLTDWILLGVLLASMVVGLWRGLVYEVLSLAGWVAAFVVAQWWAPDVVGWLPWMKGASDSLQYAVAFTLVFVLTVFAAGLVSWLIKKLVETVGLRPVDRTLGGFFGLARGVVLLLALTVVLQLTGLSRDDWWSSAQGPVWLELMLNGLKPLLPPSFQRTGQPVDLRRLVAAAACLAILLSHVQSGFAAEQADRPQTLLDMINRDAGYTVPPAL
eukprot:gene59213-79009_t